MKQRGAPWNESGSRRKNTNAVASSSSSSSSRCLDASPPLESPPVKKFTSQIENIWKQIIFVSFFFFLFILSSFSRGGWKLTKRGANLKYRSVCHGVWQYIPRHWEIEVREARAGCRVLREAGGLARRWLGRGQGDALEDDLSPPRGDPSEPRAVLPTSISLLLSPRELVPLSRTGTRRITRAWVRLRGSRRRWRVVLLLTKDLSSFPCPDLFPINDWKNSFRVLREFFFRRVKNEIKIAAEFQWQCLYGSLVSHRYFFYESLERERERILIVPRLIYLPRACKSARVRVGASKVNHTEV